MVSGPSGRGSTRESDEKGARVSKDQKPQRTDPGAKAAEEKSDAVFKQKHADDDASARAKSSRHGKVTADKWNQ